MHPYTLIPLLACLAASVMASAILSRDPSVRVSWVVAIMLGCTGLWGLGEFLSNLADGPQTAVTVMRASGFAYLPMGPLSLWLLLEMRPDAKARLRGLLRFAWVMTALLALAHFATPYFVSHAVPTDWGFAPRLGPAFPIGMIHVISYNGAAAVALAWNRGGSTSEILQGRRLALAIALPLAVAMITDVLMPFLELDGPRFGPLAGTLLGGSIWLLSFRWSHLSLNPSAFARQVLDELDDGVALLGGSGRIRAVNRNLAGLIGLPAQELIGRSVAIILPAAQEGFGDHERERETALRLATETRGDRVILRVGDDGGGIARDIRARIFDPFFTTKPVGEGTGLGLAISYHIVRKHGGDIEVESEPGRGTTFAVELPAGTAVSAIQQPMRRS